MGKSFIITLYNLILTGKQCKPQQTDCQPRGIFGLSYRMAKRKCRYSSLSGGMSARI